MPINSKTPTQNEKGFLSLHFYFDQADLQIKQYDRCEHRQHHPSHLYQYQTGESR